VGAAKKKKEAAVSILDELHDQDSVPGMDGLDDEHGDCDDLSFYFYGG
jgi:hypothetical protein